MLKNINWKKAIWIFPITIFIFLNELMLPENELGFQTCFLNQLFSSTTLEGMTFFVLSMDKLVFLVVVNILYGGQIATHFAIASTYQFVRIGDRRKWIRMEILQLAIDIMVYDIFYILCHILITLVRTRKIDMIENLESICFAFVVVFFLSFISTLAINYLGIALGMMRSFFVVYCVVLGMVMLASKSDLSPIIACLNPISGLRSFGDSNIGKIGVVINYLVWFSLMSFVGNKYVVGKDLLIFDNSL